jgi:hypothetical protein
MQKTLIILFMMALAGCSNTGTSTSSSAGGEARKDSGIVKVNSYMYEVSATKSTGASTDMEDARQQVYAEAGAFCAKQDHGVETESIIRLDGDLGRPASATLRFRCIGPSKQELPHNAAQN